MKIIIPDIRIKMSRNLNLGCHKIKLFGFNHFFVCIKTGLRVISFRKQHVRQGNKAIFFFNLCIPLLKNLLVIYALDGNRDPVNIYQCQYKKESGGDF